MAQYRNYLPDAKAHDGELKVDWGITVLNIGHNIHPQDTIYPDDNHPYPYRFGWNLGRKLDEYQLVYISSGTGIFEAERVGKVQVIPGTVFLLFPGVWHRYKPDPQVGWEEYWVGFHGQYASHLMEQDCFNADSPLIQIGFNSEIINIFNRLIETLKLKTEAYLHMRSCLTIQLLGLVYASALLKEKPQNRRQEIINNIRYKMHENLRSELSLESLAPEQNVSYVWFRKAFKELTGLSPHQYHLTLRLERACDLLKDTSLTISEIAFQSGFDSESHFSRMFKKKYQKSPSSYKSIF